MRQILVKLDELIKQMEPEQCENYLPQLEAIRQRLDYPDMKLAVIGNFSCGKSTFLNALLKTSLLAMDNMPTTAVPTYIDWNGENGKTVISITDKKGEKHLVDQSGRRWFRQATGHELPENKGEMIDYLTTTNTLTDTISKINISFPKENGHRGFCIVDTPGVNPGEEKASDHILKTQELLRDEADAAIVLFPSYQVYTRDFQEFLDQNAKHLLADSIFVVSKIDLAPSEKEADKILRFVKGRLEQNFGLEDPEVFGCSAGRALDYYTGHTNDRDSWTDSFEQMLNQIFQELAERRKHLVTEKTKKMMESLICELQTEIIGRQEGLIKAKQRFATYSYENLKKEYKSGLDPYYHAIQTIVNEEKRVTHNAIHDKANNVLKELTSMVGAAKNSKQLNELTDDVFRNKMQGLGKEYEKQFLSSMQSLSDKMSKKYEGLMNAMQGLLDRYQYNVGEFETFAYGRKKREGRKNLPAGQLKSGNPMASVELTDWRGAAAAIAAGAFAAFGVLGALAGWALYRFALSQQKEKVSAQIKEKIAEYEDAVKREYDESLRLLQKRYNDAGKRLLTEYTKEYKTFFEEKEKQLETYRANIETQIEKNERRVADMDEMMRAISGIQEEESALSWSILIEDTYEMDGRGTVVTGLVNGNGLRVGQKVIWKKDGKEMHAAVAGIEKEGKLWETADSGDAVGLLLEGVRERDIKPGCVLTEGANIEKSILFLGGFGAGKSMLISALLREDLMKTSCLPCTPIVTKITYGADQQVRISSTDRAPDIILSREEFAQIECYEDYGIANIFSKNIQQNLCIIDTPWVSESDGNQFYCLRSEIFHVMSTGGNMVFVMSATMALSRNDKEQIKDILGLGFDKEKIWFVFTHMDQIEKKQLNDFKAHIYKALAFVYEDTNGHYDTYLYNNRVFFVSALNAYQIRIGNKWNMISDMTEEDTGIPALERSLGLYAECGK